MKLRIEITDGGDEEVVIRCAGITEEVLKIQAAVGSVIRTGSEIALYIGSTEYYVPAGEILFFETADNRVAAHTAENMYYSDLKLCELAERLPHTFVRVSKSCIINAMKVSSIDKNLTGASTAYFSGSRKKAFVSRMYYGGLKDVINEMRFSK